MVNVYGENHQDRVTVTYITTNYSDMVFCFETPLFIQPKPRNYVFLNVEVLKRADLRQPVVHT